MKKITLLALSFFAWSFQAQVGIGTTAPATRLHIENSNVMGAGEPSSTAVPSLYIYNNNAASSTAHAIAAIRTNGAGSGNPYISWDLTGVMGYSMGIDNNTDQLIITNNWNFNNASAEKKMMIFNPSAQSRVIIPNSGNGSFSNSWPSGWGGGLATYDLSVLGIYYNGMLQQSDQRLKNSIQDMDLSFVNKFMSLRPVNYYWNEGIAQEVAQIFPELVFTASDEMQTKSMNYQAFHAMSARMIQLQQAQLKNQQQEINELKSSLELLDARLQSLEKK
jgi:hypothetical protein